MNQHHITVAVSLQRFAANIRYMRQWLAPSRLCVVMKADAYGHGLTQLLPIALAAGADMIGICTNPEAGVVRQLSADIPIIRLRMALPQELEESLADLAIEEQVGTWQAALYLHRAGHRRKRPVPVHLKLDTGMGRCGFSKHELERLKQVCALSGLSVVGVMTHLANADAKTLDDCLRQLDDFTDMTAALASELPAQVLQHSHNSAASIRLRQRRGDMVRVGAACYGVRTSRHFANPSPILPIMTITSQIAQIRELPSGAAIGYGSLFTTQRPSRIASIPVGFGDGYPRALFNKGIVLINGQRCPVVGRVSLNITTIDVTDLEHPAKWGDEVVLIGDQGSESISFEEMADAFASVHTEMNLMAGHMNQISYIID